MKVAKGRAVRYKLIVLVLVKRNFLIIPRLMYLSVNKSVVLIMLLII